MYSYSHSTLDRTSLLAERVVDKYLACLSINCQITRLKSSKFVLNNENVWAPNNEVFLSPMFLVVKSFHKVKLCSILFKLYNIHSMFHESKNKCSLNQLKRPLAISSYLHKDKDISKAFFLRLTGVALFCLMLN